MNNFLFKKKKRDTEIKHLVKKKKRNIINHYLKLFELYPFADDIVCEADQ